MIEHVFRRVKLCSDVDEVYVATCDEDIRDVAEGFGAKVIMTSAAHERATDRVAEAVEHFAADTLVMIQGDEPMITPEMIQSALDPFRSDPSTSCVNLVHRIARQQEFIDPNTIKVVAESRRDIAFLSTAGMESDLESIREHRSK
jgi:3-deoxy-manno-octulosonate cytidylyltransferase (CMP-KDO synthetase)